MARNSNASCRATASRCRGSSSRPRAKPPRLETEERLDQLSTFDNVLVALYDHFLRERFGKGWPTRRQQITDWINSRTAARAAV